MSNPIPVSANLNLEQYKKLAKELVKAYRAGDAVTMQRIRQHHPRLAKLPEGLIAKFVLADAQLVLAREHSFSSWTKFREYVLFCNAVAALDAGDVQLLEKLLDQYPFLLQYRCHKGQWYEEGYFAGATLLNHIAGNPYRCPLPANILDIARLLLSRGARDEPPRQKYTIGLLLTSKAASDAGVALSLVDLLTAANEIKIDLQSPDLLTGALMNQAPATAEELIRRGARMNIRHAAALGRMDLIESYFKPDRLPTNNALVPLPIEPDEAKAQIEQAFIGACMLGQTRVAEFLLEQGVDPAADAVVGQTGLHYAAHSGHLETVQMLLRRKAPLEVMNCYDGTVLGQVLWSAFNEAQPDHLRIIEALIAAGAKIAPDWHKWIEELRQREQAK